MTTALKPVLVVEDEGYRYVSTGSVDLIERCLTTFTAGMRTADDLTLTHEAERLESLPTSPAVTRMREIVATEQDTRRHRPLVTADLGRAAA
ncbi:hypothetical protein [Actinoplanes sp. HUAS TT8]|uniref:hypothetical protein n=1 Tax=Actinoplanes sp. HUAS TT8 TaxID=3447453 RepID=UPI003F523A28